ncbi:SUMF1/EgtB/PvdO family nonheme iron enzyme [Desulfoluna spongiiphila]|uniref:SUMF1/EgtB/PvdO family nonheme iron enzyme n=1 Tax=Desulfoluna spongiiphila TaxID=419481 RepID=UPI0012517B5B|nr:SUMF1/EgtB/PvdO family nonheme iron enzyme [Desulfoluna spongiiphila]VVS91344.1 c-type lectin fold [Desulfoluna spongiiphila]
MKYRGCVISVRLILTLVILLIMGCGGGGGATPGTEPGSGVSVLEQPRDVTVAAKESAVSLSWKAVPGATQYTVYWSETSGAFGGVKSTKGAAWIPVRGIKGTSWVHENTCFCKQLYYVVVAEDGTHDSKPSDIIATVPSAGELDFPRHFRAVSQDDGIAVSWEPVPCARSYTVYWSDDPGLAENEWQMESDITKPEWLHQEVEYGKAYYYDISVTGDEKTDYSASIDRVDATAKSGVLQAPRHVFAKPVDDAVELTWDDVPGAEFYTIYWSKDQGAGIDGENAVETAKSSCTIVDGIDKRTTYYFVVVASGGEMESEPSDTVVAFFLGETIIHEPVTIFLDPPTNSLSVEFEMAALPAGSFRMGSPVSESGRKDQEDLHVVELTQGFYFATTEVTQEQWQAVMGENPSECQSKNNLPPFWPGGPSVSYPDDTTKCPVESVSFEKVLAFIDVLNAKSTLYTFRLPTEAEWEYATRAGTVTPFAIGDGYELKMGEARFGGSPADRTGPSDVKDRNFRPNSWGLYHMHGNVAEWVVDTWQEHLGMDPKRFPEDGIVTAGEEHCVRGGNLSQGQKYSRSASRAGSCAGSHLVGFRLAADLR